MCEPGMAGPRQRSVSLHVWTNSSTELNCGVSTSRCVSWLASIGESTVIEIRVLAYARTCPETTAYPLGCWRI
jgi:hypothetical protein